MDIFNDVFNDVFGIEINKSDLSDEKMEVRC